MFYGPNQRQSAATEGEARFRINPGHDGFLGLMSPHQLRCVSPTSVCFMFSLHSCQ